MVIIDASFFSNSLMRNVVYKAVIPTDTPNVKEMAPQNMPPFKTLYLLHGIMGGHNDWLANTCIAQLAHKYNIAVIMPSGDNSFYVDQPGGHNYYGEFVGRELVEETRKLFRLSFRREDAFIGGLSMGGYGALRNGLKYYNTFGAIVALSAALIIDRAVNSAEQAEWVFGRRSYFEHVFGDLSKLKGSDMDPEFLVKRIKDEGGTFPRIYIACGTEDLLIENNRKFRDYLLAQGIEHTYVEDKGFHDWRFWDKYIDKALQWLVE